MAIIVILVRLLGPAKPSSWTQHVHPKTSDVDGDVDVAKRLTIVMVLFAFNLVQQFRSSVHQDASLDTRWNNRLINSHWIEDAIVHCTSTW